jgi:hypothetical protein
MGPLRRAEGIVDSARGKCRKRVENDQGRARAVRLFSGLCKRVGEQVSRYRAG